MQKVRISCPGCGWEPGENCRWTCTVCKTVWNTFETRAHCPGCGKVYDETVCLKSKGGCGKVSRHADWYEEIEVLKSKFSFRSILSWGKGNRLPIAKQMTKKVGDGAVVIIPG